MPHSYVPHMLIKLLSLLAKKTQTPIDTFCTSQSTPCTSFYVTQVLSESRKENKGTSCLTKLCSQNRFKQIRIDFSKQIATLSANTIQATSNIPQIISHEVTPEKIQKIKCANSRCKVHNGKPKHSWYAELVFLYIPVFYFPCHTLQVYVHKIGSCNFSEVSSAPTAYSPILASNILPVMPSLYYAATD